MQREPVIIGKLVEILGVVALFITPLGGWLREAGGTEAVAGAIGVIWAFVTAIIRSRVNPVT